MSGYRWTLRVAVGGCGLLGLLVAAIALVRIFGIVIAGVEPEAWVLTAMMTAPFTVGSVSLERWQLCWWKPRCGVVEACVLESASG